MKDETQIGKQCFLGWWSFRAGYHSVCIDAHRVFKNKLSCVLLSVFSFLYLFSSSFDQLAKFC